MAATDDAGMWKGFCEIESEPALFNVMLHDFGVRGVQVREVISLEDDLLSLLPQPVYGLIFLYKWIETPATRQEQSCPQGIWFANQTVNNACASVALLNIVNNLPDIELGDKLSAFKDFSADFNPALKGEAIASFDYVRAIHNSFARKIDMLNTDLSLKNDAKASARSLDDNVDEEAGATAFHFIAFMPIAGQLWKLDGLERQPLSLGHVQGEWLDTAKADIEARMYQYDADRIDFAMLGLVKDPVFALLARMVSTINSIKALNDFLKELSPGLQQDSADEASMHDLLHRSTHRYDLGHLFTTPPVLDSRVDLMKRNDDIEAIIQLRRELVNEQTSLKLDLQEEEQMAESNLAKAASRREDFGPRMQKFARMVRRKQVVQG